MHIVLISVAHLRQYSVFYRQRLGRIIMFQLTPIHCFLVAAVCFVLAKAYVAYNTPQARLPPSPPGDPIIGHARKMPLEEPYKTFAEWGKRYGMCNISSCPSSDVLVLPGTVVHAQVFGNHIPIVNSVKAAMDLLDKRARIYSDRPTIPMIPL